MTDVEATTDADFLAIYRKAVSTAAFVPERPERKFAFYARVSTAQEHGFQEAQSSLDWQQSRATSLIKEQGEIVATYFDIDERRATPFIRRAKGREIIKELQEGTNQWNALVVGEVKRVFSGSQLEDVYPLLERRGVELWIPEIGGRYDGANLGHRLLLALEGIMGKNESDTIRGRVRDSMSAIAERADDKRWLGGTPPFGFKLVSLPGSVRKGFGKADTLNTLAIDEPKADVVRRIYALFLAGKSYRAIVAELESLNIPSPTGKPVWRLSTVADVLTNATYMGVRVFGKQRKVQILHDPDDPRMGTDTKRRRNGEMPPVVSQGFVYPAIISPQDFRTVVDLRASRATTKTPRINRNTYEKKQEPFQGRIFYNNRKLTLDRTRHGKVRYRIRLDDNRYIALYQDEVQTLVNEWISKALSRRNIPNIMRQLNKDAPRIDREVADIITLINEKRRRLSNLLALVEEGDSSATDRYKVLNAEVALLETKALQTRAQNLDVEGIFTVLTELTSETRSALLTNATNKRLNVLYDRLKLRVDYDPEEHAVRVSINPVGLQAVNTPPSTPENSVEADVNRVGVTSGAPGGARYVTPTPSVIPLLTAHIKLQPRAA
jgi:DNA invertase Pin-like site-specific DNA recombinase